MNLRHATDLCDRFESGHVSKEEWTHAAHVAVAFVLLGRHEFDEALTRMRAGIRRFQQAHGIEDGPGRGYHETVTVAFLRVIDAWRREREDESEALAHVLSACSDKWLLLRWYSRRRLSSAEARAEFVEPDLEPLPTVS